MALNIKMKPDHYCRECMKPTAMVADTGGRVRQPGDWVFCCSCGLPHIWLGDAVRKANPGDVLLLSDEQKKDMYAFINQLNDPELLRAWGILPGEVVH